MVLRYRFQQRNDCRIVPYAVCRLLEVVFEELSVFAPFSVHVHLGLPWCTPYPGIDVGEGFASDENADVWLSAQNTLL